MSFENKVQGRCAIAAGVIALFALPSVEAQTQPLTEAVCTSEALAATIAPSSIGEPVSAVVLDAVNWVAAAGNTPAHCRIDGRLEPVDQSDTARPIRFGVALPAEWNGRSIQMGGGGMNGTVPGITGGFGGASDLARGFVTYGSDSGHSGGDNAWALNDEAIQNFGYMQMKKTHDVAMVLVERAYGQRPSYNYYVGGSQGGREGLTVAQRYPADYDGVLSTVPIVGFSSLMLSRAHMRIQERALANWVPPAKGNAILAEFMRRCDNLDGRVDGIINNYFDCRAIFNVNDGLGEADPWAAKRCPNDVDPAPADASQNACLTSGQIETVEFFFSNFESPVELANGRTNFGMWAPTSAIGNAASLAGEAPVAAPADGGRAGGPGGGARAGGPAGGARAGGPRGGARAGGPAGGGARAGGPPGGGARAGGPSGPRAGGPAGGRRGGGPGAGPGGGGGGGGLLAGQRYRGQEGAAADAPMFTNLGSLGIVGFVMQDLDANPLDLDVERVRARREQVSAWLDSTDPDLSAFQARGGKLIVIVGTDDTTAPSGEQLNFYQTVLDTMGRAAVDEFARLYVIPQGGHGLSGRAAPIDGNGERIAGVQIPSGLDRFALLQAWVEEGTAPGKSEIVTGAEVSWPMCSYPAYPRYESGDPTQAASYACARPSMWPGD